MYNKPSAYLLILFCCFITVFAQAQRFQLTVGSKAINIELKQTVEVQRTVTDNALNVKKPDIKTVPKKAVAKLRISPKDVKHAESETYTDDNNIKWTKVTDDVVLGDVETRLTLVDTTPVQIILANPLTDTILEIDPETQEEKPVYQQNNIHIVHGNWGRVSKAQFAQAIKNKLGLNDGILKPTQISILVDNKERQLINIDLNDPKSIEQSLAATNKIKAGTNLIFTSIDFEINEGGTYYAQLLNVAVIILAD